MNAILCNGNILEPLANPETLVTIFLHPILGWRGFEGLESEDKSA